MDGDMNLPLKKIELIYHEIMGDVVDLAERLEGSLELVAKLQAEAGQLQNDFREAQNDLARMNAEGVERFELAMQTANESCIKSLTEFQLERELSKVKDLNRLQLFIFGALAGLGFACFTIYVATLIIPGK
jgi:hypothetical protein